MGAQCCTADRRISQEYEYAIEQIAKIEGERFSRGQKQIDRHSMSSSTVSSSFVSRRESIDDELLAVPGILPTIKPQASSAALMTEISQQEESILENIDDKLVPTEPIKMIICDVSDGHPTIKVFWSSAEVPEDGLSIFTIQEQSIQGSEHGFVIPRSLLANHAKNSPVVVFMYDVGDMKSLAEVWPLYSDYMDCMRPMGAQRFIVGNKMGLEERQVTLDQAQFIISDIEATYFEISSNDEEGYEELMRNVLSRGLM